MISLDEYVEVSGNITGFVSYWREMNKKDPDKYPLEMSIFSWDTHLELYNKRASK